MDAIMDSLPEYDFSQMGVQKVEPEPTPVVPTPSPRGPCEIIIMDDIDLTQLNNDIEQVRFTVMSRDMRKRHMYVSMGQVIDAGSILLLEEQHSTKSKKPLVPT
jgi:hypothetical protein